MVKIAAFVFHSFDVSIFYMPFDTVLLDLNFLSSIFFIFYFIIKSIDGLIKALDYRRNSLLILCFR